MSDEKQQPSEMEVDEANTGAPASSAGASEAQEASMDIAQAETETSSAAAASGAAAAAAAGIGARVMASSGTVGSVSISLHPLVIMNVSEHWTRLRAQEGSDQLGKLNVRRL